MQIVRLFGNYNKQYLMKMFRYPFKDVVKQYLNRELYVLRVLLKHMDYINVYYDVKASLKTVL